MNEPRRHHILPELHLRRFATEAGMVRLVRRSDCSQAFVTSIGNAVVERDFYAIDTSNGRSQTVENLNASIESNAAPALERVVTGTFPPSGDDRWAIAAFLALQLHRGWDAREKAGLLQEFFIKMHTVNTTRRSVRQFYREQHGREASDEEVDQLIAFCSDPDRYRIEPHQNLLVLSMLELLEGTTRVLRARRWRLLESPNAPLLTSDAPVTLWSHPTRRTFGVGLATADEIAFVIGRRHALLLTHEAQHGECRGRIPESYACELNTRTAGYARRWIVHHPDDDPPFDRKLPALQPTVTFSGAPPRVVPPGL